jgi:hypothetical protein
MLVGEVRLGADEGGQRLASVSHGFSLGTCTIGEPTWHVQVGQWGSTTRSAFVPCIGHSWSV